ncbi:50S ribosomal protein L4 [archaeon]|nr:50S ribosomal protein L4 [archaeon]PJC45212.1 MAG: 50S ribosomal protein L4 [Candidatus Pacearchaeota archaeon CG_4_9_14_0_2_um_filter_30_8]
MKANLLSIEGKKLKQIEVPSFFGRKIRNDLIQKIVEAKKIKQPYGPSPVAGNQYSASGILKHHRKVWKSQYGKGISRVPRKIMTRKGSQFNWIGATVPNTRGGRRAHPPKVISMMGLKKINKKELTLAIISSISATASLKLVQKRYSSLTDKKEKDFPEFPLIVESKISTLKTKELRKSLKDILGESLFEIAIKKKEIRKGKGKIRGRKYKENLGLLLVVGNDEKIKTSGIDVTCVKNLGINDLANGSLGRLTVYTEKAIKDLGEKYK